MSDTPIFDRLRREYALRGKHFNLKPNGGKAA